jgi:hypothetical protein
MPQPFIQSEIKTIMMQLLRGVSHCHANWIVRSLSPYFLTLPLPLLPSVVLMISSTVTSRLPIYYSPTAASSRSPTLGSRANLAIRCPT